MNEAVLEAKGIVKDYREAVVERVLHAVDVRIEAGELVALVGPSGSGKSTLLHILGLLDVPTSGSVTIAGTPTRGLDDRARTALRGRALGFVFQFHHLLPSISAWENVALPLAATAGRIDGSMRARAVELLARVGLADKIESRADHLSGGQQQRVAVARALAMRPPLVLADEPTGNLDTATAEQVFELLRAENRASRTAFLIVTHDAALASRCHRRIELVDGRVVGAE